MNHDLFNTIFSNPVICGLAMGFCSWLVILFSRPLQKRLYKRVPWFLTIVFGAINGVGAWAACAFTQFEASPRTIALYIPILLTLEIFVFGHNGLWGSIGLFSLLSFQFTTLYSASVGAIHLVQGTGDPESRVTLIVPVTLMNLFLILFFVSLRLYKRLRIPELATIFQTPKRSIVIVIYTAVNAVAITYLTYHNIGIIFDPTTSQEVVSSTSLGMLIRDIILFSSTILMLTMQARQMKADNVVSHVVTQKISMEKDMRLQSFIQQGLQKQNEELDKKVKKEKELRKKLHRNAIFRISINIETGEILENGNYSNDEHPELANTSYDDLVEIFTTNCVHPDYKEEIHEKIGREYLSKIAGKETGFEMAFRISPTNFLEFVSIDDDTARFTQYLEREFIWTNLTCSIIEGENGQHHAYFHILDVDEKKQEEENIKKAASTDSLTGLCNRRAFRHLLIEYLSVEGNSGSLFMVDLDHFKSVNDTLGHPKGDELLVNVANILKETFRQDDILCRIGGDEFCAFAKGFTDKGMVEDRAKTLNDKGRIIFDTPDNTNIKVSFSLGIAIYPEDAKDATSLYDHADKALYSAKEHGRDCFKFYSDLG